MNPLIHLKGVLTPNPPADNFNISIVTISLLIIEAETSSLCLYPVLNSCPVPSQVPKISAAQHHTSAKIFSSLLTMAGRIFQYTILQLGKF